MLNSKKNHRGAAKARAGSWRCAKCGKVYAKKDQAHACNSFPVSRHFNGKAPAVRRLFQALKRRVEALGRVRVGSNPTEIYFQNRFHFAACQVRERHLNLFFPAGKELLTRRFGKPMQVGRNKFLYTARLTSPEDVDGELLSLLRQAHHNAS